MTRPFILLAAVALLLSACGDDSPRSTRPPATRTVDVSATEFAFDVPKEVSGGVIEMRFTNTGGLPHEFAFARIEEGKTEADIKARDRLRRGTPGMG